ncbi:MAG TPA: hypothetical protein PKC18_07210, partial [Lacipirellulaceae bacterium]|nr:hypothetical protein [Lacipirellulaceae bacterium]
MNPLKRRWRQVRRRVLKGNRRDDRRDPFAADLRFRQLEPRRVFNAEFSLIGSMLTLNNFQQLSEQQLTIETTATAYRFTLSEGFWSDSAAAPSDLGSFTLLGPVGQPNVLEASLTALAGGNVRILDDAATAIDFRVSFGDADLSPLQNLTLDGVGPVGQLSATQLNPGALSINSDFGAVALQGASASWTGVSIAAHGPVALSGAGDVHVGRLTSADEIIVDAGGSLFLLAPLTAPAVKLTAGQDIVQARLTADFDGNHVVDGADFLAWQRGLGSAGPGDADGNGVVDADDLVHWRDEHGRTAGSIEGPGGAEASLLAMAGGDALLEADNNINVVAATAGGYFRLQTRSDLEVAQVDVGGMSLEGVVAPAEVRLSTAGSLGMSRPIESSTVAIIASGSVTQRSLAGDVNGDLRIDGADLLAWQRGLGTANPAKSDGDANGDGVVDGADLGLIQTGFGVWNSTIGGAAPGVAADLLVRSGGGVHLENENDVGRLAVIAASSVHLTSAASLTAAELSVPDRVLGGVSSRSATARGATAPTGLTLRTSGSIGQTAEVTVGPAHLTAELAITLDLPLNDFTGPVSAATPAAVALTDRNSITLGQVGAAAAPVASLTVRAEAGAIDQNASGVFVAGATSLFATADIPLTTPVNDFGGPVQVLRGVAVALADANVITLAGIGAALLPVASLHVQAASGAISQAPGGVFVLGLTQLAAAGDVSLGEATNDFGGAVHVNTPQNVTLTDANSILLGAVLSSGGGAATLTVSALGGSILQTAH